MENKEHLRHLFTEDIYVIDEQKQSVQAPSDTEDSKSVSAPKLKFRGDGNSELLLYNYDKNNEFISQGDELFLQNVLKAIKLNISNTIIVNAANEKTDFSRILTNFNNVKTILTFGINKENSKSELYKVSSLDKQNYLRCDSLSSIEKDKEKKKALWGALQELFL